MEFLDHQQQSRPKEGRLADHALKQRRPKQLQLHLGHSWTGCCAASPCLLVSPNPGGGSRACSRSCLIRPTLCPKRRRPRNLVASIEASDPGLNARIDVWVGTVRSLTTPDSCCLYGFLPTERAKPTRGTRACRHRCRIGSTGQDMCHSQERWDSRPL
ncbi:hypothetical protein BJX63DRAFT_309113 [Aspergillus granulosus]|uniref:Uncharacterized protein n=1 Tax=Aspergillus granulosus TaxID=176169 RepID=A0ABR4H549_9EURO